jgi:hypothetical protein
MLPKAIGIVPTLCSLPYFPRCSASELGSELEQPCKSRVWLSALALSKDTPGPRAIQPPQLGQAVEVPDERPRAVRTAIRLARGGAARCSGSFRVADHPGVIAWWLESKCRVRPLLRVRRYTTMWSRSDSHSKLSPRHLGTATLIPCGKGCPQHLCSSHAEGMPVSGKATFQAMP